MKVIDPWGGELVEDYSKIVKDFGLELFDAKKFPSPNRLMRRGVVFAGRDLAVISNAIKSGKKFYVLYRKNRSNDFRASGSMKFNYDIELPKGLLDYTKKVFESFDVPYIALDVGIKENDFFLFEFQFLSFGQDTLEKSSFYYHLSDGKWQKEFEKPDLEREIATSVSQFIKHHS